MKIIVSGLFWTVAAVLVVPAILGVLIGVAAVTVTMLVGFLLVIAALALMALCGVPIVWWCAIFDSTRVYAYLNQLQVATKSQVPAGN